MHWEELAELYEQIGEKEKCDEIRLNRDGMRKMLPPVLNIEQKHFGILSESEKTELENALPMLGNVTPRQIKTFQYRYIFAKTQPETSQHG